MGIVSIDLRSVAPCEDVQALKGKHSQKYFKVVFDHLSQCDSCKPIDFVCALREQRKKNPKKFDGGGVSKTTCRWVARVYKAFDHTDKHGALQQECAWFIIRSHSYDLKVELSWALTADQVIDAILYQVNEVPDGTALNWDRSLYWPTNSYRNKWRNYDNHAVSKETIQRARELKLAGTSIKKSVTREERANDLIFERASFLEKNDLRNASREDFYKLLDVAGILNG